MNEIYATLFALLTFLMVAAIMLYGLGFMFGGHAAGMKALSWAGKHAARFGRWLGRSVFGLIESFAGWAKGRF